ncbi:TIGR03758 family integrating conjugative element protein [Burkholderia multivorans]|uniref:TIGR03758 family integrating conjugative element protein n=1 Tax=Burkholderia multivorans TaxID=87883 RepID=UPI0021BE8E57|nr:TIGR03758 family integrating conjugative element protein [Burkholderia multivorans]
MNLTGDQLTAFQSNGGFQPTDCSVLLVSVVFVVVLIWGVWALPTAYAGWAAYRAYACYRPIIGWPGKR